MDAEAAQQTPGPSTSGAAATTPVTVVPAPARGGALSVPAFRLFAAAMVALTLGVWLIQVGQMWLVQQLTGSPFFLGLVPFFWGVPMLTLSLLGGVVADRVDRRSVLIVTRGLNTLVAAGIAVLALTGVVEVWHILLMSFCGGVLMAFDIPARQSLIPTLVPREHLTSAIAIHASIWNGTNIIGPAVAGPLIAAVGTGGCFVLGVACSAVAIGCFIAIRFTTVLAQPPKPRTEDTGVLDGLREGFRYLRANRIIVALMVTTLAPTIVGQAYISLLPSYTADVLLSDAVTYSQLLSAGGIGALLGSGLIAWLGQVRAIGRVLLAVGAAFGVLLAALAVVPGFALALAMLALLGAASSSFFTISNTAVQELLDDHVRARVTSVYMLMFGMQSLGSLAVGALGSLAGVQAAIGFTGVLTLAAIAISTIRYPELRRL